MAKFVNLAKMTTTTTGTGTITLGSAVLGFNTFANAGVANGDVVAYGIEDSSGREYGYGTYSSSGPTLTRNVTSSTNSNSALNLSGTALVYTAAGTNELDAYVPMVATRTALKAIDTTRVTTAYLTESGREGTFVWRSGNYATQIAADTSEGVYVKATAIASSAGSWVRDYDGTTVNVKWFGAAGDGTTNDTTAVQAALSFGAKRVLIQTGTYLISSGLTVPNWLHVSGVAYQPTITVGSGACVLKFSQTSGVAMALGYNALLERLVLYNSGASYNDTTKTLSASTAIGVDLASDNITLNEVAFHTWASCIRFGPSPYYVKTDKVEFNRCTNGYVVNGVAPYNVHISAPISRDTTNFFLGQSSYPARNIKIFGGSIEGYSIVASDFLDISVFGTYFETISQRSGAIAIAPGVNGCSVSLFGCNIYMSNTSRFVSMSSRTDASLTSFGNTWAGAAPSGAIFLYLPSSGNVSVGGDNFGTGHNSTALYVDSIANAAKFSGISFPKLPSGNTQINYSSRSLIGYAGYIGLDVTAAPSSPVVGMTVLADGSSWDPLSRAAGRPYWTVWQGDRWRSPGGGT